MWSTTFKNMKLKYKSKKPMGDTELGGRGGGQPASLPAARTSQPCQKEWKHDAGDVQNVPSSTSFADFVRVSCFQLVTHFP